MLVTPAPSRAPADSLRAAPLSALQLGYRGLPRPAATSRGRHLVRPQAISALPFIGGGGGGGGGDDKDADGAAAAAAEAAPAASSSSGMSQEEVCQLRAEVEGLKNRMDELQAQLEQLNDRARERAVSLAAAVRAAGEGDAEPMELLQHQQDEQGQDDEKSWDTMMETFTQLMSKGYIQSVEKIRDRLLLSEWELTRKASAQRRGVSQFELFCAENKVDLPFELLSQLYEDPASLDIIADPHLRMQARGCINGAVDEEYIKVYGKCTEEAQKLAQQFSNTEFISKIIPESGVLDALKKVVPMALKMVV